MWLLGGKGMGLKGLANKIKKEHKEKNKSFTDRFLDEIDKFLVDEARENRRKSRLAFRPSQYSKCERMTYYFLKGIEGREPIYPRTQRIFAVGTSLHEWIQEQVFMEMEGYEVSILPKHELPFYEAEGVEILTQEVAPDMEIKFLDHRWTKKFPISAMIDGAMEMDGHKFLFEFKTINPKDFEFMIEPLNDHIMQGALYSLSIGIRKIIILYLCKGTQNFKAYEINYTDEQLEWVAEKLNRIETYVLEDALPPKEEGISCRFCKYKNLCNSDRKE